MRAFVRWFVTFCICTLLAGCGPGQFYMPSSLSHAVSPVEAIPDGDYIGLASSPNDEPTFIRFEAQTDGTYLMTAGDQSFVARVYGPLSGYYLFEFAETDRDPQRYSFYVFTIDSARRISVADDSINKLMASVMHDRLGITASEDDRVSQLTDSGSINLALLQELFVLHRQKITFNLFLAPK